MAHRLAAGLVLGTVTEDDRVLLPVAIFLRQLFRKLGQEHAVDLAVRVDLRQGAIELAVGADGHYHRYPWVDAE